MKVLTVLLRPVLLVVVLLTAALPAVAENGAATEETREKLESVQERIETTREKIERTERKETGILGSIETLEKQISTARRKTARLRTEERDLLARIRESKSRLTAISQERRDVSRRLSRRLVHLYKAGNASYLKVVLEASDLDDLQRRSYYLQQLANHDSELFSRANDLYRQEKEVGDRMMASRSRLSSTRRELEENLVVLGRKKNDRDLMLAAVRDRKDRYTSMLEELEDSAQRLEKLVEALDLETATGRSAFSTLKGSLKRPVSGKVILGFGRHRNARFNTYTLSRGLTIRAAEGTPVRAVYNGRVIFADWFRGYGRIVILDHGGGYYTLYGHLSKILVDISQEVATDDVVGNAGDSGSLEGPALYFEIRRGSSPVDPGPWFSSRR